MFQRLAAMRAHPLFDGDAAGPLLKFFHPQCTGIGILCKRSTLLCPIAWFSLLYRIPNR
jgi:hypothetical protein